MSTFQDNYYANKDHLHLASILSLLSVLIWDDDPSLGGVSSFAHVQQRLQHIVWAASWLTGHEQVSIKEMHN